MIVNVSISGFEDRFNEITAKQIPFATARAVSQLAKLGKEFQLKETIQSIDRPTPFTAKDSMYSTSADKKGPFEAEFGYKRIQSAYLSPLLGGERRQKPFERIINGRRQFVIPGSKMGLAGYKIDRYGNVPYRSIIEILDGLKDKTSRFFLGPPKGGIGSEAVYARIQNNEKIVPVLLFIDAASYQNAITFDKVQKEVENKWPEFFNQAFDQALATAR